MVSLRTVEEQLKRAGSSYRYWGRAEIRELCNVLMENEEIQQSLNGHYEGGFALLTSTNQRILLVDKKPMFLTLEDIRYDMISEIQFSHRLLDATVRIFTPTKSLVFTSWNRAHLRKLVMLAQQHVMAMRQYQQQATVAQQQQQYHQPVQQPQQFTQEPIPGANLGMSQMTMPHPQDQAPSPYTLNPNFTAAYAAPAAPQQQAQPMAPFPNNMNPFLRTPLITRHRTGLRRW